MEDKSDIKDKYILYGASFNPPHIGHLSAIYQMLKDFEYVVIFTYPKTDAGEDFNGIDVKLPLKEREEMVKLFIMEFFPKMQDRVILTSLRDNLGVTYCPDGVLTTYQYLNKIKQKLPIGSNLTACLGVEAQSYLNQKKLKNYDDIEKNYGIYYIKEENPVNSNDVRAFFKNNKNVRSVKDLNYIKNMVGNNVAQYIFDKNLYNLHNKIKVVTNKKIRMNH